MTFVPMADATAGAVADPDEYNRVTNNVRDLDTRMTALATGPANELIKFVIPTQSTALVSGVTTSETDIPKLAITSVPVTVNFWYEFQFAVSPSLSSSGDTADFRLRHTTPVSGTSVGLHRYVSPNTAPTSGQPVVMSYLYKATATGTMSFYLSVVRTSGAGTVAVQQTADIKNYCKMRRVGVTSSIVVEVP